MTYVMTMSESYGRLRKTLSDLLCQNTGIGANSALNIGKWIIITRLTLQALKLLEASVMHLVPMNRHDFTRLQLSEHHLIDYYT